MVASGYGVSVLPGGSLSGIYKTGLVVAIPFEAPAPSRRVALAWREGYTRPQVIEAIIEAVKLIDNSSYLPIAH
jgi:LysR family hydrogen peroxide-inducible transcriptional activator